ncbi:omega-hydroxyceramide transacylase [Lepidochelys kempii]|uniref:omega-hydroxyceramide transacylase n=1 Tax=Lepidochelys kempii TaxID=8472 RepID=UPI003C6F9973
MLISVDPEDLKESFHEVVRDARKTILGPLSPGCNTLRTIQKGLYKMLPENSHQVASGRLHISLTRMMDGQNVMVSEFSSKEDLIQALICSCFVPIYCGFIPPSFRGVRYVDGGFTNLQPCSDLETVITVSPFTGELDICPRDCPAIFYSFQILNSSIQISMENLCRFSYALFPPSYLVLNEFFSRGYQDAVLFLHRNNASGINYPANTVNFQFASLLSKNDLSRASEESSCQNPDAVGLESNGPAPRDPPPKQAPAVSGTLNGTDQKILQQLPPRQHKGHRMLRIIEKGMSQMLPENSHQLASGKLCISLTRVSDLQNVIISEYRSKEEVVQAVICSCFLPVYCGFNPPSFQGMRYIDGGMTNMQPGSDSETMITVSPYTGEVDICPRDCPTYFNCISVFRSTFLLSAENLSRFSYSIFPPSPPVLREFYLQGYHDAIFFLQRHSKCYKDWEVYVS